MGGGFGAGFLNIVYKNFSLQKSNAFPLFMTSNCSPQSVHKICLPFRLATKTTPTRVSAAHMGPVRQLLANYSLRELI